MLAMRPQLQFHELKLLPLVVLRPDSRKGESVEGTQRKLTSKLSLDGECPRDERRCQVSNESTTERVAITRSVDRSLGGLFLIRELNLCGTGPCAISQVTGEEQVSK